MSCFTIISNASSDILQNGWRLQYVVSQFRRKTSRKKPSHLNTDTQNHLRTYTNHIGILKEREQGLRRRPPLLGMDMGFV